MTFNDSDDTYPPWLPDVTHVTFTSDRKGKIEFGINDFELYLVDDKGAELKQITSNAYYDAWGIWSPDGKKVVYCSNKDYFDIYVMNSDGKNIYLLNTKLFLLLPVYASRHPDSKSVNFHAPGSIYPNNNDTEIFILAGRLGVNNLMK